MPYSLSGHTWATEASIKDNISLEKRNLGSTADITVLYDVTTELPPGTTPIILGELEVDDI